MADSSSFDPEEMVAESQRYLTTFRVLELKELLKHYGQSTKGRKPELFQRANDLLGLGSPKFQTRIREIYDKSTSCRRHLTYGRGGQKSSPVKGGENSSKGSSRAYVVHPDVKFKAHPFFSKLETITRPTALVSSGMSHHGGSLNMRLKFHLTPQQIHHIYVSNAKIHVPRTSTGTYQTQVLVRFCLQETTCDQNDYYPKQCYLKVNGHNCPIPGYHPHLSTRPDYKRNGQPVNVTNYVKTSPAEINEVVIYWAHDIMMPQGYCVGIEMSKVVSSSDLLQSLRAKGVRSPDMSRALVKEKFAVDKDSEISATSMKVSLLCPIGKMRMTYPCRTTSCSHLQCFDASIFFQMNEKRARWVCPVCDKLALPGDLFIDGLFMEICQKSPSSDSIIEFLASGTWQAAPETSGGGMDSKDGRGNSPISLDSSDVGKKKSDVMVIDLTASSDEEDNGGTGQEEEEEEEGEGEQEEEGERSRVLLRLDAVPRLTSQRSRLGSEDAGHSDSESTLSSHSSSTIAAPPTPPPLSLTHPHTPLAASHAPSLIVTPSHPHIITLPSTERGGRPYNKTQSSLRSSDAQPHTPSLAGSSAGSAPSSAPSRQTSVIMQCRPSSSSSDSQSRSLSQTQLRAHSRSRKHSQSSSHHPYSHSSHYHHRHKKHQAHSSSTRTHSRTSTSNSHASSGVTEMRGAGKLSQDVGLPQLAPYFQLHTGNGFSSTPGDAVLTSNIWCFLPCISRSATGRKASAARAASKGKSVRKRGT